MRLRLSSVTESHSCGKVNFLADIHLHLTDRRRYLNKLCDQLVCLLSSEHSKALVWSSDDDDKADEECEDDDDDDDDASTNSEKTDPDRFVSFEVAKTKDQEENVAVLAGFMVCQSVA